MHIDSKGLLSAPRKILIAEQRLHLVPSKYPSLPADHEIRTSEPYLWNVIGYSKER